MFTRRRRIPQLPIIGLLIAVLSATIPVSAAAQGGLFDFLFGSPRRQGPPPSASAYSDPFPGFGPGRNGDTERRAAGPTGSGGTFCVRLCDGRYFPIQRASGANPTQLCNSFCPAAATRVFSGGAIEHAAANDGSRYASLSNAFAYRERTVENCTCNGRDPYGLMTLDATSDPTLRSGDIVATNDGFVAYTGGRRHQAEFTPIESHPGVSGEWRQRLMQTRIVPANASPVTPEAIRETASAIHDDRDRRVQLDR